MDLREIVAALRKGRVWIAGVAGLLLPSFWIVGGSE
jgi:hypothetical protein